MDMKKIIKETIGQYLNDKILIENSSLNFPQDYVKKSIRKQSVKPSPNLPRIWMGVDDDWYESKEILTKKYRDVPVKMKHIKNINGTNRGYKIVSVGFEGDLLHNDSNHTPSPEEVREVIDNHYKKFEELMSTVSVDDNELENLIAEKNIKVKNIYEENLFETAIRWIINKRFNINEKKRILKFLMVKGLNITDAINFFQFIR
jgi:hypothetical protein